MIKFIITKIRKNFLFLFNIFKSIIFLYLILNIQILQAKVIGYVEEIKGNAIYKENDQTIELDLLDEIATGVKFFTQNDSTLSVSLDDGTILIIYENSEFLISSFNNIDTVSPGFEIIFSKGSFIIETGEIPKLTTDKAIIKSPSGDLYLNGTALSADFSSSSNSQVFLITDSFGKKGEVSHVGFACGGYDFIHSQGYVKKESLDQNDPNFNKSLLDIYLASASIRLKFKL